MESGSQSRWLPCMTTFAAQKKKNSPRNESHKFLCTHIDTHEYRTPFENLKIFYSDTKTRKRIDRAEQIKTQKYLIYTPTNAHIFI